MKTIRGKTLEEQMKHVDQMITRIAKSQTAKGIITPYPISGYTDIPVQGIILKYMFPTDGIILAGGMYVEAMPKDGTEVIAAVRIDEDVKSTQFFAKKNSTAIEVNLPVVAGSRLTVSVRPKGGAPISGIWISLVWMPDIKDAVVKKFLMHELNIAGD